MNTIINYKILTNSSNYSIESDVKRYMSKGWQPLGGISVSLYSYSTYNGSSKEYTQAMVKYGPQQTNSI